MKILVKESDIVNQREFKNEILQMLFRCYIVRKQKQAGFKLNIENNPIISIANTAEALLTMEQLFGKNFLFHKELANFNFDYIKNFLINEKNKFINLDQEEFCNQKTSNIAFCGIGLLLLNEENAAKDIIAFLTDRCSSQGNMWGTYASNSVPDIYATYVVTMLMNRLHMNCQCPRQISEILNESTKLGIPFNENSDGSYIEALTIAAYMCQYYYGDDVSGINIEYINAYFLEKAEDIYKCVENHFPIHPETQYHIFTFGLAGFITENIKLPFFIDNNHYILEMLKKDFVYATRKSIPFCLELCRLYNAVKRRYDPFQKEMLLDEVKVLHEKIIDVSKDIKDIKDCIVNVEGAFNIAICFLVVFVYFVLLCSLLYYLIEGAINLVDFENNYAFLGKIVHFLDIIVSVIIPILLCFWKRTRSILIKLVKLIMKHVKAGDINGDKDIR